MEHGAWSYLWSIGFAVIGPSEIGFAPVKWLLDLTGQAVIVMNFTG